MLFEGVPRMRSNKFEGALGVGSDCNSSAYLAKGVRSFVDLDIYMVVLEETKR